MRVSLSFTGFGSILADLAAVRAADECGFDGVWYAEHICAHDAVVPATVYLRETERLELVLMGISAAGVTRAWPRWSWRRWPRSRRAGFGRRSGPGCRT